MNDPEITRKSPGNHPEITPFSRLITSTLLLLFTFAIGNVWGACPEAGTIFKFATKSSLSGNTNITDNPVAITTENYLASFEGTTGSSLTAHNEGKKFQIASNGMKLADGAKSYLILDLGECTLKAGDIVKIKVTSQNVVLSTTANKSDAFLTIVKNNNEQTLSIENDVDESTIYLVTASNGAIVYSLEIIRPYTITLDAATNGGTVSTTTVKGAEGDKVVLPHAFKSGYKFKGWYTAASGGTKQANLYTVSGNATFVAQFEDNPTSGVMFSLAMQSSMKPSTEVTVKSGAGYVTELDLLQYALISGGAAKLKNSSTSNHAKILTNGKINLAGSNGNIQIDLDFALAEGDKITFEKNNKIALAADASGTNKIPLASGTNEYPITKEDCLYNQSNLFILRDGSNVEISSITITRPAPVSTHTLTWDFDGGSTTSTTHTAAGQVAEGATITYPANNTMSKDGYDFAGWSTSVTTMPNTDLTIVAQWTEHVLSDDATLSDLTVGGETVSGFAPATLAYNVELPFGTTIVPAVAGTANSTYAKSVVVTPAASLPGSTTVVVTAEDNSTKTYTVNFTVADSKDIRMAWATSVNFCSGATKYSSAVMSDDALVSAYINKITFTNVEGSGDDGTEGGSLNVGKKAGNMFTLSAKPGYAMKAMTFAAKIQDANCEYSLNGGAWQTLTSIGQSADKCYEVFADAEVHEFRLRSTGASGIWIRNMELSIITACTPVKLNWTAEPAAEYEVGKAASAIAATANNGGAVAYSTTASGIVNVAANGALTIAGLGSATLKAATAEGDGTAYCTNGGEDIVISKAVNTYYLVKLDAQNETDVTEVKYYSGDDAIALPTPSYSGYNFQGWFDATTGGNKITETTITPTASRTIYAQWVAECTGPTINVHPAGANYLTGRTASALTCEATAGAAGELTYTWYSCDDAERTNPVVLAGAPTPSTAVAGTFYYYCAVTEAGCDIIRNSNVATITIEDKEPVCIIKSTPTSGNDASVDGYYKGSAFFKGSDAKKLSSSFDYVGVQLMAGKSFLATDKVVLNQAADLGGASDITKFYVFTETPASGKSYATVNNATPKKGDNWFAMPAELVGKSSFYIGRVDSKCNPTLGYLAVYRAMNPELIAITINGRDGVIDPLDDKHFTVTIPYSAALTDLSIVKTVAWNAPHATTPAAVKSNEGAWIIGDNTYRLMDKDGDYTDYTITLAREAHYEAKIGETGYATLVKAVEEAVDGDVIVLQENVAAGAGVMIAKADAKQITIDFGGYTYTANSPAVGSVGTQNQAFHFEKGCNITLKNGTITSEGSEIKMLIQNYGDLTLENITLDGTGLPGSHAYVLSNNCGDVVIGDGATITAKTGDVAFDVCATNYYPEGVTVTVKSGATINGIVEYDVWGTKPTDNKAELAIEGGTLNITWNVESALAEDAKANLNVSGGQFSEIVPADYCAPGYAPVTTPNAQGKYEVQDVRVVIFDGSTMSDLATSPSGAISWAKVGSTMGAGDKDKTYKDVHYTRALSCGSSSETKHFRIDVEENTNVKIEVIGMSNSSSDTRHAWLTNSTKKGEYAAAIAGLESEGYNPAEFETEWLEEGSYYLHADNTVAIFLIRVTPKAVPAKCEVPTITTQPATKLDFGAGAMTATVVAEVADGGTLKYQWYNAANNEAVAGATEATLSTTTEGTYYVIVTNTLADHRDNFIKSAEATLGYRVTNDATLSALSASAGTLDPTFDKDVEEYRVDLPEGTAVVPTLSATATMDGYANVAINNATAFVNYEATSTVVVTSEDGKANKTYMVKFYVDHVYTALVDVTESTTWNWSGSGDVKINDVDNKGLILANYIDGANFEMIEGKAGEYARRAQNDGVYQGTYLHFNTTVAGKVKFYFRAPSSAENCTIYVNNNGKKMTAGVRTNSFGWSNEIVVKGDVVIEMENDKEGGGTTRVQQIVFTELTPDYTRNVSNNIGTLCVDHNVLVGGAMGATFYQIASRNELYDYKIDFEEVLPNEELKAGEPYIFKSNTGKIELFYGTTVADAPVAVRGMHGWFSNTDEFTMLDITAENKSDILYIAQNKLWNCEDLVDGDLKVVNNRAYIVMSEVPTYADYVASQNSNNAPRRRVTLSKDEAQVATGFGELETSETPVKVLINGQIFIIRGEKMFDATGRLVK